VARVSLIVPTYNESDNIVGLLDAVRAAMSGHDFEICVVDDDSPDRTWQIVADYGARHPQVSVMRRVGKRGLSAAVVDGFGKAKGELLAVMDADQSHDPLLLPALVDTVLRGSDLAVGSRRVPGGGAEKWPWHRKRTSDAATWLARHWLRLPLSDPMSGYFVLRRTVFEAVRGRLHSRGYKLLLEIVCHGENLKLEELPYIFRDRRQGVSKLGPRVAAEFLKSLWELRHTRSKRPSRIR
jgi:dolichol-phosphate mannosyltransferase